MLGNPHITATSIQYNVDRASEYVEGWRTRSRDAGIPWVIDMDENASGLLDNNADDLRRRVLYDVLFSGGNIEWLFGFGGLPLGGDVTLEDFRTREAMWGFSRNARTFMETHLPYHLMQPADYLVSNENNNYGGAEVFAAINDTYAIYLPAANGNARLQLPEVRKRWDFRWYNPVSGQFEGSTRVERTMGNVPLGRPPSRVGSDWVILVTRNSGAVPMPEPAPDDQAAPDNGYDPGGEANLQNSNSGIESVGQQNLRPGQTLSVVVKPTNFTGGVPSMYIDNPPQGSSFDDNRDGTRTFNWTPGQTDIGTHRFRVIVTASNATSEGVIDVEVTEAAAQTPPTHDSEGSNDEGNDDNDDSAGNLPPMINALVDAVTSPGTLFERRIVANDPEGYVPALMIDNLPPGAEFTDNGDGTRTLQWTPSEAARGEHQITVTARDAIEPSLSSSASFTVVVR